MLFSSSNNNVTRIKHVNSTRPVGVSVKLRQDHMEFDCHEWFKNESEREKWLNAHRSEIVDK